MMLLGPRQLGEVKLSKEELEQDRRKSIFFGPTGLGDKAIYLNSFYRSRHYYLVLTQVRRVYKRLAVAQGAVQATIPYLVVVYDDNREKQCIFKVEKELDLLLEKIREKFPHIAVGKA